jgi:hypothetical protein
MIIRRGQAMGSTLTLILWIVLMVLAGFGIYMLVKKFGVLG